MLGAAGSSQIGAATATTLLASVGPVGALFLRFAFAAIVLVAIRRPPVRSASANVFGSTAVFAVVLIGMNLCFYEALDRTPLGIVVAVEFVGPLVVAIAGARRPHDVVWAVLAATGILILSHPRTGGSDVVGIGFALLAGGFWASYIFLSAHLGRRLRRADGLALAMVVATFVLTAPGLVAIGRAVDAKLLAIGLGVAVTSSVVPYWLEMEALRVLPPRIFGVLLSMEPAVAVLAGFVFLGQVLRGLDCVAIGLITAASVGALGHSDWVPSET